MNDNIRTSTRFYFGLQQSVSFSFEKEIRLGPTGTCRGLQEEPGGACRSRQGGSEGKKLVGGVIWQVSL